MDDHFAWQDRLRARRTDPETSKEAAKNAEFSADHDCALALHEWCLLGPQQSMADHEVCARVGKDIHQRCSDLREFGYIEFVPGDYATTPRGGRAKCSRATFEGRKYAKHLGLFQ